MIKRPVVSMRMIVAGLLTLAGGCAHHQAPQGPKAVESDPNNAHVRRTWLADLRLRKADPAESIHLTSDKLFVYTDRNQVYALSRTGGTVDWGAQVGEPASAILPPLELGDRLVFPCNTRFYIYDQNGILDHPQELGFALHAPGVTDGKNMVYIPAAHNEGQRVAAVDIDKRVGEVIWEFLVGGPIAAAPTLHGGVIYVGSEDNRVYAVSQSREPVWPLEGFAFETSGRIVADVRADDSGVYVASTDTKLYCLDRTTGRIKWQYYAESPLSTSPFLTADLVYQYAPGKGLVAIQKQGTGNRSPWWVQPDAKQVLSTGTRGIYVRFKDDSIGALDKSSGKVLWRGTQHYQQFVQNFQDATIFVGTNGGAISAFLPVGEATPMRAVKASAATKPAAMPMTPGAPAAPAATPRPAPAAKPAQPAAKPAQPALQSAQPAKQPAAPPAAAQ